MDREVLADAPRRRKSARRAAAGERATAVPIALTAASHIGAPVVASPTPPQIHARGAGFFRERPLAGL
jgi:hypothetical protein